MVVSGQPAAGLFVISGPGGVGKGTVVARLRRCLPQIAVSVSATTRPARPGEVDGEHYHFIDEATFDRMIAEGAFLEWAEFAGRRYGTPWTSVERALGSRQPVVLEIDIQGARQVRERLADAVLIFLAPPSVEELVHRLRRRGTDDDERVARRMDLARWEMGCADEFDHVVVNGTVEQAAADIARILGFTDPGARCVRTSADGPPHPPTPSAGS